MAEQYDPDAYAPPAQIPKKKPTVQKKTSASLRKAPQAPKRFKSSYICFFMDKQAEIKQELGPKASVSEVSKRSAELWRCLPADERAHWDEIAAKDKQRYMIEKATYTGPWQVPWKRAKKDPTAPKRPMSAFLYFSQDKRKQIKADNPELRNTEVSRILGKMWREASEEERSVHVEKEKMEREKYKIRIKKWREEEEERMEEQRKVQAEQAAHTATVYGQTGAQDAPQSPEQAQYNFPPVSTGAYDQNLLPQMGQYQPQQQQQQQANQMYSYPQQGAYPGYSTAMNYGYNPSAPQANSSGRQMVVLGPNGMPHYQPQYAGVPQMDQNQAYDDFGEQGRTEE